MKIEDSDTQHTCILEILPVALSYCSSLRGMCRSTPARHAASPNQHEGHTDA